MSVPGIPQTVVRFGVFEADLRAGELRKNGRKVKIQDLPFRALNLLLAHPNKVVTRDEFRRALWPEDVFVDFDRAISSAIKRLRDALGDSAENPIFIETLERRGYRWIAPVHAPAAEVEPEPKPAPVLPTPDLPQIEPHSSAWKWAYVLAAVALVFVAWSFRRGLQPAKAALTLSRSTTPARAQLHPANQEAKDLYLQGRYYWNKRTPDDLRRALDYFTQSIVRDPGYAEPYIGLADCYNLLREYTTMPGSEAYPRALAAARKAVELDDHSSQAHASLAFASFWGLGDATTAEHEFRRAVELDPNNATAHHWYATYLEKMGRASDALTEINRAQALDPTSNSILADKGVILAQAGRLDASVQLLQKLENAEPRFLSPHRYLKAIYLNTGDYPNYLAEMKKEAALTQDSSALAVAAAAQKGFDAGGPRAMFAGIFREQKKSFDHGNFSPYILAQTCALLRDTTCVLKYLRAAIDRGDDTLVNLEHDAAFNFLNDDPAFRQIRTEVSQKSVNLAQNTNSPH